VQHADSGQGKRPEYRSMMRKRNRVVCKKVCKKVITLHTTTASGLYGRAATATATATATAQLSSKTCAENTGSCGSHEGPAGRRACSSASACARLTGLRPRRQRAEAPHPRSPASHSPPPRSVTMLDSPARSPIGSSPLRRTSSRTSCSRIRAPSSPTASNARSKRSSPQTTLWITLPRSRSYPPNPQGCPQRCR